MTAIYHITHISNLPNIIREGGLWCDRESSARGSAEVSIAHQHIKERRAQKDVPCTKGGKLSDYVPFYFAPRSPMLYAIHRRQVEGYNSGQAEILHLVSSTEAILGADLPFAFTDGHAEMDISLFYSDQSDLAKIDWRIMQDRYWHDTDQDGDRKRRRQAEFLVHHFFPISLIEQIGVINQGMALKVTNLLQRMEPKSPITIQPGWYYD